MGQKGEQMHFAAVKKSTKRSGFVIYSKSKESAFTAIKAIRWMQSSTWYLKGVPFVSKRYMIGVPFLPKMVNKRVRGQT